MSICLVLWEDTFWGKRGRRRRDARGGEGRRESERTQRRRNDTWKGRGKRKQLMETRLGRSRNGGGKSKVITYQHAVGLKLDTVTVGILIFEGGGAAGYYATCNSHHVSDSALVMNSSLQAYYFSPSYLPMAWYPRGSTP